MHGLFLVLVVVHDDVDAQPVEGSDEVFSVDGVPAVGHYFFEVGKEFQGGEDGVKSVTGVLPKGWFSLVPAPLSSTERGFAVKISGGLVLPLREKIFALPGKTRSHNPDRGCVTNERLGRQRPA